MPKSPGRMDSSSYEVSPLREGLKMRLHAALVGLFMAQATAWPRIKERERMPSTIELTSRPTRRQIPNTLHNLALENAFNGTELQWYGTVQIGTPPQNFSMTFDTGSSDMIFPSIACTAQRGCIGTGARFDANRSKSFTASNRPWQIQFATGAGVGVGSAAAVSCSGSVGLDTVTVAGVTVQNQGIGLINKQSPNLFEDTGIEGIFGMGIGTSSALRSTPFFQNLINQKKIDQPVFSLFLSPKSVGKAQLTLGGVDTSKYTGSINYLPVSSRRSWNITFQSISVNGRPTNIQSQFAIADSGTSNMIAPARDARAIYAMISPNIKLLDPKGAYGIPCSEIAGLNATITFTMQRQKYSIPASELSVGPFPGRPGICQTLINSGSTPFWVIGGSLMKYYYTVWDVGNRRMGWANTAHSPRLDGIE